MKVHPDLMGDVTRAASPHPSIVAVRDQVYANFLAGIDRCGISSRLTNRDRYLAIAVIDYCAASYREMAGGVADGYIATVVAALLLEAGGELHGIPSV